MIELLKRYRWIVLGLVAIYAVISLWLFCFTEAPQNVPFEYELH